MSKTLLATLTIIGATMGAGMLGIPYVIAKSGFTLGLILMIFIALVILLINLYIGEIALRTKGTHQLTGYAEKYLGQKGRILMTLSVFFGVYAALVAYLVAEGESLSYLIFNTAQYQVYLGILFWLILSVIGWFGLKALEEGEEVGVTFILITIISIVVISWNKINPANLSQININQVFTPFGVVLFAFLGFSAIPEVIRMLKQQKTGLKKSLIAANLITLIIYIIFTIVVVGTKGTSTPPIATLALGKPFIFLGMITMLTAYLVHTNALIDTLRFDFKKSRKEAWLIVVLVPLALFLILSFLKIAAFTKIIGFGGAISGGLAAILILFMVKKAKAQGEEKPAYSIPYSEILTWILIILFVLGALREIINLI
ncbi:MAG: aromatic amino acid transport family protein [Nanoarchaeota archaeon]|nr:aromatic amino acid transport family protein [Nanoarchaeota archaeon]